MIIRTQALTKLFRTDEVETTALDEVSLTVSEGEFTSIMGPSGCGKSTLLHILGLIDNADGGEYWFLDEDVSNYSERQRASLRSPHAAPARTNNEAKIPTADHMAKDGTSEKSAAAPTSNAINTTLSKR